MTDTSERYQRQLLLIGETGQEKLSTSRVLIAGAGGLGTTIATFLAVAGIGFIRIVDEDTIERNNLNRQILYREPDRGEPKAEIARQRLVEINPEIEVQAFCTSIDDQSFGSMVRGMDIIMDGMDNFSTRYVLNRAALRQRIPFIHGAVSGFYGQVTSIVPGKTPCLRCIVPHPPSADKVPIIGVTCGVIGSIQATEAIKYLTGRGDILTGRLLLWDGFRCDASIINVVNEPDCSECSGRRAGEMG